jgi:uncharacterized membrane protein
MFRRFAALMLIALLATFVPLARPAQALTYSVTTTADSGAGSLRQAITNANTNPGPDTINFNIPGAPPAGDYWTITLASPLPDLSGGGTSIDGATQPGGRTTGPKIVISGAVAGVSNGFKITSASNTIANLAINGFIASGIQGEGGIGVYIVGTSATGNRVIGCWIGLSADGASAVKNAEWGVLIDDGANNNTIGGTTAAERNVISGNGKSGFANVAIKQYKANSTNIIRDNSIKGNYIGTTPDGLAKIGGGNPGYGILLGDYAQSNTVGGTTAGERNVIAGHDIITPITAAGVFIAGDPFNKPNQNNIVRGNYIGVGANGTTAIPNGIGVQINRVTGTTIGVAGATERNVISGNSTIGIVVEGSGTTGTTIANNWIGVGATGASLANTNQGVSVRNSATGTTIGPGNVISANGSDGVLMSTGGNTVKGNYIGTDVNGTASSTNGQNSILVSAGTGNTIGGPNAADRNVIAVKASLSGIRLQGATTSGTLVYGNYIGVDKNGAAPLVTPAPSSSNGILIVTGSTNNKIGEVSGVGAGNIIGGAERGITLQSTGTTGNIIKNNSIGVGASGQPVGNSLYGIRLLSGATNNTIGGALGTEGNLVANNGFDGISIDSGANNNTVAGNTAQNNGVNGVRVFGATGIRITQTQTSSNVDPSGLGIALAGSSPVGNNDLAAPTNLQFSSPGGTPTLSGNACNGCVIEVFTSPVRDDGEGPRYLATTTATAGGAFSVAIPGCDRFLTATARNASNDTSRFTNPMIDAVAGCQAAQADVQLDAASPPAQTVAPGVTATYQHTLRNTGNASGNFTISSNPAPSGWTVQVNPTSVTLAAGATTTINVSVTPPANAAAGAVAQTTITASVGSQTDQKTDTTTVQQVYAVDITPNRSGQVTPPGTIDYSHTITNNGNGSDTIGLTATSTNPGVSVSFPDGPSCTLAAGASCTLRVRITVAAGASGADTTTVRATSQSSAAFDQVQDTTTIVSAAIPSISSATPNPQSILPGNTATFNHTVTNIGNIGGQFTVSLLNAAPAGWTFLYTPTTSFTLAPGATQAVQVTISAKTGGDAPNAGSSATAQVQVESSDNALATTNDTATALLRPAFTFTAATQPTVNNAHPSQTVVFTHTLTNDGNGTDTFNITITPPGGWTATPIAPITLARNASQQVIVRVQVPDGQGAGSYPFDVTAQTTSTPQPAAQTRTNTVVVVGAAVPTLSPGQIKNASPPLPTTVSFTHILTNTGNQAGTFSLAAAVQGAPAGWSAAPSQPSCSLVQNASCTFTVNVTVPAGANAGDQPIVVTASIAGPPPASDSVIDIVRVPTIPGVQFTPNYPSGTGDPGEQVAYIHTLTNTGNATDSYTITLATDAGWNAIANPAIVANVPRGATRTVTITVTVPSGVPAGSTGTVTATATSTLVPHPSASVVDRTTINAKPGATLVPDQQTLSANPTSTLSDTVTFQHTLRNSGSIAISYTLSTTNSPPRWTTIVTPTQVGLLAPGAETTVSVKVTVPPGTAFGEVTTTTLKVQQLGGPSTDLATARDITRVGPQFGALLTPPLNRRAALPGTTVVYTHTLRNSGLEEDTFLLSTIAPNGWDTRVAPSSVSLLRNGSTTITVTVQVPTSALSTTVDFPADMATVRAQSVNDINGFGTAQEETTVLQVAGVSLSPPRIRTATPGRTISFQHTLLNTGNGLDTFDLTWTITGTGVLTWTVIVSPLSETLRAGDNYPAVLVNVQVPANAAPDAIGRVIVTATSRSSPGVIDRLEDLLVGPARLAAEERIYLPVVSR